MMRKGIRLTVSVMATVFVLVSTSVSVSQTSSSSSPLALRVVAVQGTQAVLKDRTTGAQTTVKVGDVIQDWTVVAISPTAVELERDDPEQGRRVRAQLPVGMGGLVTPGPQ